MSAATPSYNASFYAKLFNLGERRIQQLAKDGVIPREARGKYPLIGTIQGYVTFLQTNGLNPDGDNPDSYRTNRNRLIVAQAVAQEMKNQILQHKLAPLDLLELSISKWSEQAASLLNSIPLKVKKRVPKLKASEIEIIKREIVKVQNAISRVQIDWDELPDVDL